MIGFYEHWQAAGNLQRALFAALVYVLYHNLAGCGYSGWGATGQWLDTLVDCREECCCRRKCLENILCTAWQYNPEDSDLLDRGLCYLKQSGSLEPNDGSISGDISMAEWFGAQVNRLVLVAVLVGLFHFVDCPRPRPHHYARACKVIIPVLFLCFLFLQILVATLSSHGSPAEIMDIHSCSDGSVVCRSSQGPGESCPSLALPNLGHIVREVAEFFEQERHLAVYPWDLSLVSALRFGGAAVECRTGICMANDDVDFMIAAKGVDQKIILLTLQRLMIRLQRHYIVLDNSIFETYLKQLVEEDPNKQRLVVIGPRLLWGARVSRRLQNMTGSNFKKKFIEMLVPMLDRAVILDFKINTKARTVADSPGGLQGASHVLFEGQKFTLPFGVESELASDVANSPQRDRQSLNLTSFVVSLCDLRFPRGLWPQDGEISDDPDAAAITGRCGEALQRMGYLSFTGLCGTSG